MTDHSHRTEISTYTVFDAATTQATRSIDVDLKEIMNEDQFVFDNIGSDCIGTERNSDAVGADISIESMSGGDLQAENIGTLEAIASAMKSEKNNEKMIPVDVKENVLCCVETSVVTTVVTTAQGTNGAATKNNGNGMVLDNVPATNDNKLGHLASDIACQDRREECSLGKTGTFFFFG